MPFPLAPRALRKRGELLGRAGKKQEDLWLIEGMCPDRKIQHIFFMSLPEVTALKTKSVFLHPPAENTNFLYR